MNTLYKKAWLTVAYLKAIRFTYCVQQEEVDESEKSESSVGDALQLETVYLLHGKFTYLTNEDSLDMIIISLRKGERPINEIVITHPSNGRLAKSITAAQKNATVQFTGILTIHEKRLYCDALDFSFIGTKFGENNVINNPWSAAVKTEGTKSPASRRALAAHTETKASLSTTGTKSSKKTIHETSPAKLSSIISDETADETDSNINDDNNHQESPSPKRRRKK